MKKDGQFHILYILLQLAKKERERDSAPKSAACLIYHSLPGLTIDSEEELKNHVVHSKNKETEAQRSDLPQLTEVVSDKPGLLTPALMLFPLHQTAHFSPKSEALQHVPCSPPVREASRVALSG